MNSSLISAILIFFSLPHSSHADIQPGALEIIQAITERRASLERVLIDYSTSLQFDEAAHKNGIAYGFSLESAGTVAFDGDKRFSSIESSNVLSNGNPSKEKSRSVFRDGESRQERSGLLYISSGKSGNTEMNAYLNSLLWPYSEAEIASTQMNGAESHFFPTFFIQYPGEVKVQAATDSDQYTHILTRSDGKRTVWVDTRHDYAIVKAEIVDPVPGEAKWSYTFSDFESHAGLAWPKRVVVEHVYYKDVNESKEMLGQSTLTILVKRLAFEALNGSIFTLNPLPGQTVINTSTQEVFTYAEPSDDRIESTIAAIKTHNSSRSSLLVSDSRWSSKNVLIILNVLVFVAIAAFVLFRRNS